MTETFIQKLEAPLNKVSAEKGSSTPDYILAAYIYDCLTSFDRAIK